MMKNWVRIIDFRIGQISLYLRRCCWWRSYHSEVDIKNSIQHYIRCRIREMGPQYGGQEIVWVEDFKDVDFHCTLQKGSARKYLPDAINEMSNCSVDKCGVATLEWRRRWPGGRRRVLGACKNEKMKV